VNSGGGALSFTGAAYDSSATLAAVTGCPFCAAAPSPQNHQFDAGTFEFVNGVVAVPEPGSIGLLACGLFSCAAVWRRRRQ
jgi:hypothetical protein